MYDWRADVRSRIAVARLHPQDEIEIVEEVAEHLEAQFAELAPRIGEARAREQLLAQLRDEEFDAAFARRRRRHTPAARDHVWTAGSLWRDVRYGARSLRRSPGMVAAGVLALALGIGLSTVMFSIIYGLLIKGLPFDNPEQIAIVYRADPTGRGEETLVPFGDFVRYRAEQRSSSIFGGYYLETANVTSGDSPERVNVARVTASAMYVTGVRPILGRTFGPGDNALDAPATALLGYTMWRDHFAADSSVLNKSIRVNGQPHVIIGVMPEGYEFPRGSRTLWLPIQLDARGMRPGDGAPLTIVTRLREGVEYTAANAELAALSRRLVADEPSDSAAARTFAQPFIRATMPGRVYALLYAMLGAVLLVLLVACANVANLLLDRAANRTREIGIRLALGASRAAVVRQSLVESGVLALVAAIVGALLAQGGVIAFNRALVTAGAERPFWMDVRLHLPVLAFVLLIAAIASIASGLLPAFHSARLDINTILKDESHAASSLRAGRLSRSIVLAEITLSTAMLLAAGFMTKSIAQARKIDPRFTTAQVFTARASLTTKDSAEQRRFFETVEHDLLAVPGLDGVYLGNDVPGTGWRGQRVAIEGRDYARERDYPIAQSLAVSPGFFRTFGVPVIRGRAIIASDHAGSQRVALVNEEFARRNFPGVDPIGRRIKIGQQPANGDWHTIVGITPTMFALGLVSANGNHYPPEVLTAFWQQSSWSTASIALRGAASVANAATVRKVIATIDPELPVYGISTMEDALYRPMWPIRVFGTLFVIFGISSLLLAAIGLYAVMAFSVSRRVREMGIRLALGARAVDVVRMICWQGAKQILIGISLGLLVGGALVRVVRMLLFEVQPTDPTVFALVATVLAAAAFVACLIPAIRATRVDPLVALRTE